jgi:hypothetical protein
MPIFASQWSLFASSLHLNNRFIGALYTTGQKLGFCWKFLVIYGVQARLYSLAIIKLILTLETFLIEKSWYFFSKCLWNECSKFLVQFCSTGVDIYFFFYYTTGIVYFEIYWPISEESSIPLFLIHKPIFARIANSLSWYQGFVNTPIRLYQMHETISNALLCSCITLLMKVDRVG